jgi:hypothetical protein
LIIPDSLRIPRDGPRPKRWGHRNRHHRRALNSSTDNTQINSTRLAGEIPSDADPMTLDEYDRSLRWLKKVRSINLPSFAKINLDLRILGTRADGYHDLRTVFQSLALFDNVTVSIRRGPLTIACDEPTFRR